MYSAVYIPGFALPFRMGPAPCSPGAAAGARDPVQYVASRAHIGAERMMRFL
jgi:hypothetical protein